MLPPFWHAFLKALALRKIPTNYCAISLFDFNAEADATRFSIATSNSTQGSRFTFNPFVSYPLSGPGWFVTPKFQWHVVSYDLSSVSTTAPAGQPRNFSFNVPTFSVDSGLVFERSVRLFATDFNQTLEPRLFTFTRLIATRHSHPFSIPARKISVLRRSLRTTRSWAAIASPVSTG